MWQLILSIILGVVGVALIVLGGKYRKGIHQIVDHNRRINPVLYFGLPLGVVSILLAIVLIVSISCVWVGSDEVGHLTRIYLGKSMKPGQIIAFEGENGPQARVLAPGFHFEFFIRFTHKIDMRNLIEVQPGYCGKLYARDGIPLREEQIFADEWPAEQMGQMLDATYFLSNKGQKGPQLTVLKPGKYRLNLYLWDVNPNERVTNIEQGFVGVVKSNAQQVRDQSRTVDPSRIPQGTNLVAQLVPKGHRGIWEETLPPGQYYLNTDAFNVTPLDTKVRTWTYAGGFTRRYIDLSIDQEGGIQQKERVEKFEVPKNAVDMAIINKIEGWEVPLDVRVLVQIEPQFAPFVVASVGGIEEVETKVLTPTIRSVIRNVCGELGKAMTTRADSSKGKDEKIEESVNSVLDLIDKRAQLEIKVKERIAPECLKAGFTVKEVRFGEPAIPPELLVARLRQQLAQQLKETYNQEQQAQMQRIQTEKARAEADQQPMLIKAEIEKQAAEKRKETLRLEGEGEKNKLLEIAEGQKAQVAVLGEEKVLQLAMLEKILEAARQNPEMVKVPHVLVQGTTGGLEGAAAVLGNSTLTTGLLQKTLEPKGENPRKQP